MKHEVITDFGRDWNGCEKCGKELSNNNLFWDGVNWVCSECLDKYDPDEYCFDEQGNYIEK